MNITDYVKVFGEQALSPFNLNESDVLVLTALSYIDFSVVSKEFSNGMILSDAINQLFAFGIKQRDEEFLINLRNSKRFSDLYICGYWNEHDKLNNAMQFSALTIKISDNLWFISYSGTDGTIVGWKEDFQFAYLHQTPAQESALVYLSEAAYQLKGNFIISGHSKGGNLAAYAAIFADTEIQDRINTVFCNDSPGFNQQTDILSKDGYYNIVKKIHCILPQDAIIGQLLQTVPEENYSVILSISDKIILQHDIFNWQIDENGNPEWLPELNPFTVIGMKKINNLFDNVTMGQREKLINCIFDLLETKNIRHVDAIKYFLPVKYWSLFK